MKKILFTIMATLVSVLSVSAATDVLVTAQADSVMLWIGEQTGITVEVSCEPGQKIEFPVYADTIVAGLEIIPPVETDTVMLNNSRRMTVRRKYLVTSFDSAQYYIPSFAVKVDGEIYESDAVAVLFQSVTMSDEEASKLYGPKEIMQVPMEFREQCPMLLAIALALILYFLISYLISVFRDNKPIIRRIKVEPKVPAHTRALAEIEKLKEAKSAYSADPKEYYTKLTDIVREYINERFGFNATEMTSGEILENLRSRSDSGELKELAYLFETSDFVKFAKLSPQLNENDMNLMTAMEFVQSTKIEQSAEETEPKEEVVVEEKRSKPARMALLALICMLCLAGAAAVAYACFQFYYLYL